MIKQISNRLTGKKSIKLKEEIQKIYSRRELVDEIRTKPTNEKADNYWLDWYINIFLKTYDDNYIKARKLQQILPLTLMPKSKANLIKNVHNCIINYAKVALLSGDYITCKQIRLPKPLTDAELINHISDAWDILLPYAIEEYGEDLYIRLFSLLGTLPQSLWREGPYEYKNVRLNESDIVIDAGANMGWFAAVVSAKAGVSHSFEPVQCTRENYLVKTAELNKNIIIHDYALSDKKSEMKLHYDNKDSVSATLVDYRDNITYNGDWIKVQTIDLDSFVNENNLPRIDFIKADIEGAERYMLMGAKHVLKDFKPKLSLCKYHLPDDSKVLKELILDANPNYIIEERWSKIYAYVPR